MGEIFNNAINPKDERDGGLAVSLMPSRAHQIKTVKARANKDGIGGETNVRTGTVWIPTGRNAEERTIRFHEAMHAAHSPRDGKPADMLDQALEDARLHRYCSKSAESEYQRARRDELSVALRELRKIGRIPELSPRHSLATLRALAILDASELEPAHDRLLGRVLGRFGKHARDKFQRALGLLSELTPERWDMARKTLQEYFREDYREAGPSPLPSDEGERGEGEDGETGESMSGSGKSGPSSPRTESDESEEDETDYSPDDSEDESEGDDSPEEGEDEGDTDEGDAKDESEGEAESPESPAIAPTLDIPEKTSRKRSKPTHPDAYTADLTPECDKERYRRYSEKHPLELRIKRLDLGINRVKLSLGRRTPLPVASGRQILARKLASAMSNPSVRVFARPVAQGGFGTILIDASGSMSIPESTLIAFLAKAPALTLGFYNAPNDSPKTGHGNLYIYAANGYRATMPRISLAEGYGSGNLIDYQAMAWLIKQPAPRYLVTDKGWTGYWATASYHLCPKLQATGQIIVVKTLEDMEKVLADKGKGRR